MKLKRLDIHGFKSFYHRTTLAFDEGVTAVVGPNGCGKSNLVDAIKWVMGEQGPKALRGAAMEDVIFNGTGQRGPLGLCEVRLTFANDGSAAVPARWREVEEIAVERRMERGGGSTYLVNRTRCRLIDVQELIAGTGVGSGPGGQRAYAIVEQGQIERIVGARAEERRVLIEEAAGITRYRARKRVAERKMEETRYNLERVADVVGEVESRLRSLRRQAKKAERYTAYRAEAREIALAVAVFEYRGLIDACADLERAAVAAEVAERDSVSAVEAAEAERAAARLREKAADEQARGAAERLREAENEIRVLESQRELVEREAEVLAARMQAAAQEHGEASDRRGELVSERAEAERRLTALQAEVAEDETTPLEEALAAARAAQVEARAAVEARRRVAAEAAQAMAAARAGAQAAGRRAEELMGRGRAGEQAAEVVARRRAELGQAREEAAGALEAADRALPETNAALAEAEATHAARGDAVEAAGAAAGAAREALVETRSRLRSLEEIEARREELGEGPRAVLERGEGVVGTVAEVLSPPAELERPVAAALGPRMGAVVVTDLESARASVELLRARGRGRGIFAAADAAGVDRLMAPAADGVRGVLADLLGVNDGLPAALLGDALLVESLEVALRLAREGAWPGAMVTPDGDRVDGSAFVTGGHGEAEAAPLSRRREIRALTGRVAALEAEAAAGAARAKQARAAAAESRTAIDAARTVRHEADLRRAGAAKDLARLDAEARSLGERAARLEAEAGRLAEEREVNEARLAQARSTLAAGEAARGAQEREMGAAEAAAEARERERDEALAALHEARTRIAARRERIDAARQRAEGLRRQIGEADHRLAALAAEQEAGSVRHATLLERANTSGEALARAREVAAVRATAFGEVRAAHEETTAAVTSAESAVEARRRARDQARDERGVARLACQERELVRDDAARRIREAHRVVPEEALAAIAEVDEPPTDADRERLAELEALLDRLGDVNLTAIEEFEEVRERHTFLSGHADDLRAALADLEAAIDQINRTSRQLFRETFDAVNARFKEVFPRLFRGGEAELVLTDPHDLLETGIEMLVQPPGKKVQHVGLLSGGEKAMCAIALVFAVFQVRPSPFCLLDEVDAPLDEANIGRFNELVREMARQSQIVLITHNKRTMEIADVLYGITMEEAGVSKLVSVRVG